MTSLTVGAGQEFSTITAAVAAAHTGDTINVQAGTYTNDFPGLINGLTIQGVNGIVHLVATAQPPNGKAIFDVAGNTTLVNLDFRGATVGDGNGAGIRYESGNLIVENSSFEHNQEGILGAADPNGTITIDHSDFDDNSAGDGRTHNIYIGDIAKFTLTNSYVHNVAVGHEVKSRAETNVITGNRIYDNTANGSYSIDLPNGGNATISNNVIEKGANAQNGTIIAYGEEGSLHAGTSVSITGNELVNDRYSATAVWNAAGSAMSVSGNSAWNVSGAPSGFTALSSRPALDTSSPIILARADTTPPTLTATESASGWTRLTSITLSGTVSDAGGVASVDVFDLVPGHEAYLGAATIASDGSWSLAASGLADGTHNFVVQAYDRASNQTGVSAGPAVLVDTVAPTLSAGQSASGTTASTGIVLSGTVADTGSGVNHVELFDTTGSGTIDLGAATLAGNSWQLTDGHLASGWHDFKAVAYDQLGNSVSSSTGGRVTVAPTTLQPAILRVVGNMDGGVTVLGSAAANSAVTIADTSAGVTRVLGTTTADASGAFRLISHSKMSVAAVNTFAATATDAAGQTGASAGLFQLSSAGNDVLSGTAGQADVFATFLRTGQDTISGFETTRAVGAAHDVVNLSGTGYAYFAQVAPHISGTTNAVIQLDSSRSVTLLGVAASTMQASDFRFS